MKKLFLACLASSAIAAALSSCATGPSGYRELSDEEKIVMMENARYAVTSSKTIKISPDEKKFVKENDPEIVINYTGDKEGVALLTWTLKGKTVRMENNGKFNDRACNWKMSVTDSDNVTIIPRGDKKPAAAALVPAPAQAAPEKKKAAAPKTAVKKNN